MPASGRLGVPWRPQKLIGALDAFGIDVADRRALDAGASPAGSPRCSGPWNGWWWPSTSGTANWPGRCARMPGCTSSTDQRPRPPQTIGGAVDIIVADLSFISLSTVPALTACADPRADIVPMVKDSGVGRGRVGAGRRHRPQLRAEAVLGVPGGPPNSDGTRSARLPVHCPGPSGHVGILSAAARTDRRRIAGKTWTPLRRAVAEGHDRISGARTILLVVHPGRSETNGPPTGSQRPWARTHPPASAVPGKPSTVAPCISTRPICGPPGADIDVVEDEQHSADGCELVLVLGGGEHLPAAAELARKAEIPVLGVNLGRIGFLAEAEAEAIDEILEHVVAQDYRIEHRMASMSSSAPASCSTAAGH